MKKFSKKVSVMLTVLMILAMSSLVFTASAADTRMVWDFSDALTEDIGIWEGEGVLYAYEPWSTADLEIDSGKLMLNHMHQDEGCNSLDLTMNKDIEDLSAYKSVAFWIDTTKLDRAFTIKVSIIDYAQNFISISADAPYALYPDNGKKEDRIATTEDANWVFLTLPEKFKGYIEMPFESMKCLNWNANNKKDIDAQVLKSPFRLLLEFNDATDGEVTYINNVQLIKSGAPEKWVEGKDPVSSTPDPVSSTPDPVSSTPAEESNDPVDSEDTSSDSEVSEDESDIGTGSEDESSEDEDESKDESKTSKPADDKKGGNTALVVILIIVGVAVVAGGGFAAYKFIFSKNN